jgi:hypothetical protein
MNNPYPNLYGAAFAPRPNLHQVIRRTRKGFLPIRSRFLPSRQLGKNLDCNR